MVLKTTDYGNNWFVVWEINTQKYFKSFFIDCDTGWLLGEDLIKTTDGGIHWTIIKEGLCANIYENSIYFINKNIGWIATNDEKSNAILLKTIDGGKTWKVQLQIYNQEFFNTYFLNEEVGFISEKHSREILKTRNGGATWEPVFQNNDFYIYSFFFNDINTGWAIGSNKILISTNSGDEWKVQDGNAAAILHEITFFHRNIGWIIGENSTILRTTNGGVTFIEEENKIKQPENFILTQNYPNPFNPTTKIKFTIPAVETPYMASLQHVTLKVYDVLGREIQTLVNEEKSQGNYEVSFNGGELPSGVYFYSLQAGDFHQVRKMLLLK